MTELIEKLIALERRLSECNGAFNLFALFLPEDAGEQWDLLVAAPWVQAEKQSALKILANELSKTLDKSELLQISRIVVIEDDDPALDAILSSVSVLHKSFEVKNSNFFGLQIQHAYIITAQRLESVTSS